ncbi:MAG: PHP domain-containing protein [Actinobacteria bacterium]|nr:PHP domain-containing protein [Actinomycetota bacterium]
MPSSWLAGLDRLPTAVPSRCVLVEMGQVPVVHMRTSSMYSMKYAVPRVEDLAHAAAAAGQPAIALVDRDSLGGAVRFVRACESVGVAPILGVDLAVQSPSSTPARPGPAPVKGGRHMGEFVTRVGVLAYGGSGWSSLCRLVSRAHGRVHPDSPAGGEKCAVTVDDILECSPGLVVMLGPQSEVAGHIARRRPDLARRALQPWLALPAGDLLIEVVSHRTAPLRQPQAGQPDYSTAAARRLLAFAHDAGLPAVMSNAVRYIEPNDEPVADVLDAVRTLTTIDQSPRSGHGAHLLDSEQMRLRAHEICAQSPISGPQLLRTTASTAYRCRLNSEHLGLGTTRVPEVFGIKAQAMLEQRCWHGMTEYELVKRGTNGETTDVGRSWINVCNGLALSLGSTPRAIADAAWSLEAEHDLEDIGNSYWPDGVEERLAEIVTQAIAIMAESSVLTGTNCNGC